MLKRLELVGFKSFADKTTFDFGDGITAIVGPNGSGKSNIVDAVRWILGEQSAKSLRGGEMADVIFNGSTTRRSFGMAEVTMSFDNRRRRLATEADEVQITRRVYRTGEGEYLINQQITRLKDIKDLFLGSGAGHDAYCIIEQGKVDVLLQASTRERRTIFEEAAGISRFKAKKIETQRKLERVDQNLQRLQDIIDEVDKQLRNIKLQAAKAQRYQEYSERLKQLRLSLGLAEYHELSEKLRAETEVLEGLRGELDQRASRAGTFEAETARLEELLAGLDDKLREQEAHLATVRQGIQTQETTLHHEGVLTADLEIELGRTRLRLTELTTRVAGLAEAAGKAREELTAAAGIATEQRRLVASLADNLQVTVIRLAELRQQVETDKARHLEHMRQAAHLQNEAVATKAQVDNLSRERERLRLKTEQATENLASIDLELQELQEADAALQARLAGARQSLTDQRSERERLRQLRDETSELVSTLRQERSGLASRVELLEGLLRSHEGLGTGVREVFGLLERNDRGRPPDNGTEAAPQPWGGVLGMIADFLTVRRDYAPLIDLALGEWSQRFIVRDIDQLVEALEQRQGFSGRVSFVPLNRGHDRQRDDAIAVGNADGEAMRIHPPHAATVQRLIRPNRLVEVALLGRPLPLAATEIPTHPGLVALAEQLVACDQPELADLPVQLLGRTLIVRDLASAREIAAQWPGFRMVTLQGETLELDGTLTVGSVQGQSGILSRKSELQDVRHQVSALDLRIAETERTLADLRERVTALDTRSVEQQEEIDVLAEQAADLRSRVERHRDRRQGLHEEVSVSRDEMQRIDQDIAGLQAAWQQARDQAAAAEVQVELLYERIHQADAEIHQCELQRHQQQQECTAAQVSLAKAEERLSGLEAQHRQLAADFEQRRREHQQSQQGLASCKARLVESQRTMLQASAALAQGYLDKEAAQGVVGDLVRQRDATRQERAHTAAQAQTVRNEWKVLQEHAHSRELEASELRHLRDALADRIREDYQVELAELYEKRNAENAENAEKTQEVPVVSAEPEVAADSGSASASSAPSAFLPLDPAAANEEIAELRRKLSRLGAVNLEALQELNELETRSTTLQAQNNDLVAAKKSLEEIISKINQDSRRLFTETFESVRAHFQELFRKLFGGGMADIVFEDEADVLESGIEIIARPPGKELRSISLMSGGEKTLTAVALLLAIFRSKPSPFCILDEVDAALDEANISRFTAVLREFLDRSQFILVTHSKKTMASADVLYGITMQESGISKQVSVRFEDWPDDPAAAEVPQPPAEGSVPRPL